MSEVTVGGDTPVAGNAAEGGAPPVTRNADLSYGVTQNANEFRNFGSDGNAITSTAKASLVSVVITQEINTPAMCQLVFDVNERWGARDYDQFVPGAKLEMLSQVAREAALVPMYVSGMRIGANGGRMTLTVTGFDKLHFMRFGTRTKPFVKQGGEGMTDEEIFAELASSIDGLGFSSDGLNTALNPYVVQDNESDYDFLMRRCRESNYECSIKVDGDEETLFVRGNVFPPIPGKPSTPRPNELALVLKRDIQELTLEMRVPTVGSAVRSWGYDVSSGVWVTGYCDENASTDETRETQQGRTTGFQTAEGKFPSSVTILRRPDLTDSASLDFVAGAERTRLQDLFVKGDATLRTINYQASAGVDVALTGMNVLFDGDYCITKSTHHFDGKGNHTVLALRRSGICLPT